MRIINNHLVPADLNQRFTRPTCLSIGNFDGVHRGHQELIRQLVTNAKNQNLPSVVLTFNPHPLEVLRPQVALRRLFDLQDQEQMLSRLGVDFMFVQKFTPELARYSGEQFFNEFLIQFFQVKYLHIGHDFQLGKDRESGETEIAHLCEQNKIHLNVLSPVKFNDEIISSTLIRDYLEQGEVSKARELLGRSFYHRGVVVRGDQRGRQIGFPTANLQPTVEPFLRLGVYKSIATLNGKSHLAISNIGVNPTFVTSNKIKVETHILDFAGDIYGQELIVEFLNFIRPEKKFSSREDLVQQIQKDILEVRSHG